MTTLAQPAAFERPRHFPSGIVLVAAAELVLISLLLLLSNSPGFYAAAIACALCSVQLGVLLIGRFRINTLNVRNLAKQAEFSSNMVLITDASGRIKWTNPSFTRATGFNLQDIVGQTFAMVLHGQETDTPTVEKIRKKIRATQPFEAEIMQYDRGGKPLWVTTRGEPVCDARREVTHYLITQIDVSDQHRQAHDALALSDMNAQETVSIGDGVEIVRKLAELDASDNRAQLEKLISGLKVEFDQVVADLPKLTSQLKSVHPNE